MTFRFAALALAFSCLSAWSRGALDYVAYNLASPETPAVPVDASAVDDWATYREGTQMLFVRDDTLGFDGYLAVYEVTQAQAVQLCQLTGSGWLREVEEGKAGVAYNFSGSVAGFLSAHPLTNLPLLSYPSVARWQAYAGEPQRPCNVYWGESAQAFSVQTLAAWYAACKAGNLQPAAAHGARDMYGNVAEYTTDSGKFYGGYAHDQCGFGTLSADYTGTKEGYLGARLVYTPPAAVRYTAKVTLDGVLISSQSATAGSRVTLEVPEPAAGRRLLGPALTPEGLTLEGTTFTMPAGDVCLAYTSKTYATLALSGGSASAPEVLEGESVRLSATLGPYDCFESWELPDGTRATENPLDYTASGLTGGETLTFRATVKRYPRVLVYGGQAQPEASAPEGADKGEGFYAPGTHLTLSAHDLPGYTCTGWHASKGTAEGNSWTVGDYDTEVTLRATYALDAEHPQTNPLTTLVGEADPEAETPEAAITLGYEAAESTTRTLGSGKNPFTLFATREPEGDYAALNLATAALSYPTESAARAMKQTALPLKRTRWAGETYYIGLFETTQAQIEHLRRLDGLSEDKQSETAAESTLPFQPASVVEAKTLLTTLSTHFGCTAALPTKAQIEGITRAAYQAAGETYKGAGHLNALETYGDKAITLAMMVCGQAATAKPTTVGSKTPDPYGFYDLWGNANELWADGKLYGGHCTENAAHCNAATSNGAFGQAGTYPSLRPAVVVPAKLAVTLSVADETASTKVLPGQVIRLAPQVCPGKRFEAWQATTASGTETLAAQADGWSRYTVSAAVTLTACFADRAPLTVSYTGCTGPAEVLPGETTALYALAPTGQAPEAVAIEPAGAATWDRATQRLTFAEDAQGAVSVTATYPAPAKPALRLRLY